MIHSFTIDAHKKHNTHTHFKQIIHVPGSSGASKIQFWINLF